jgi:hypothetical protein
MNDGEVLGRGLAPDIYIHISLLILYKVIKYMLYLGPYPGA